MENDIMVYKTKFINKILDKTKIHTIRTDKENKWKKGMCINHSDEEWGIFKQDNIVSIQRLDIFFQSNPRGNQLYILIDGFNCPIDTLENLIANDGFESTAEFVDFFKPKISKSKNMVYNAKLIHWTNKRY